jgi:enoyl-CoA hydratase/carnithine racemase
MSPASVSLERQGPVAIATLSNPPRHTMTVQTVVELARVADAVEADPALRVLVLTGSGEGVFVAHYEVGELAAIAEHNAAREIEPAKPIELHPLHRVLLRFESLRAVTVAALNGNAAGGGCELALACDFRLMADGAFQIGLPETSVGIIPGAGGTQRMARLLGSARALDLILHGQLVAPAEALAIGLVHRLLPAAGFRAAALDFAGRLASRAPLALAEAKRAIRRGVELPLEAGLALEQQGFERTMRSRDAAAALRAFLREPEAFLRGGAFPWQNE